MQRTEMQARLQYRNLKDREHLKDLEADENNPKPTEYDGTEWIQLVLAVEKWQVFENTVLKLRIASNSGHYSLVDEAQALKKRTLPVGFSSVGIDDLIVVP